MALKGAVAEDGRIVDAFRFRTPLWAGLETLNRAFDEALPRVGPGARHRITITGELSDLFEDRAHGVETLVRLAEKRLGSIQVYAGAQGFFSPDEAVRAPRAVASANWRATATLLAGKFDQGLLVDIGSTTSDLVPFARGAVAAIGDADADRLASGALVYTGATRTPVMAVCREAPFAGSWHGLVAEHFADMADVRRITGDLPPDDHVETADRRPATIAESRARLARMIGRDASDAPDGAWRALACFIAERQLATLFAAACLVLSRGDVTPAAPIIDAGGAAFLTRALASRLGRAHRPFEETIPISPGCGAAASDAAPACAVALLRC